MRRSASCTRYATTCARAVRSSTLDFNPELKKCIERAYAYYIDKRTASFHIDRTAIETSTILSYEEAVDIVEESLKNINNICKNW